MTFLEEANTFEMKSYFELIIRNVKVNNLFFFHNISTPKIRPNTIQLPKCPF